MQAMSHSAVVGTAAHEETPHAHTTATRSPPTTMVDVVFPERANHHGTLFGGAALAMMDKLAFLVATRETRRPMVTANSGRIDFHSPIPQGRLIELSGNIVRRGTRSIEVDVSLIAEDLCSGIRSTGLHGHFTLVSVGDARTGAPAAPVPEPVDEHATRMVELVFPSHTNHIGTLYGGQALEWLGKAAFVAASRLARMPVVMASSDRIDFHAPVLEGEIVDLSAKVVHVGNSSLVVEVTMHAEELLSGQRRLCTRGQFTMVAIAYDGRPTPVAPPRPISDA